MAAIVFTTLLSSITIWFKSVNDAVREPYLDEVFHIRQAQHYCARRWDIWDPKITTPPGVYLLSYVARPVLGCSITALRALNVVCLVALMVVVKACYDVRRRADGVSSCNRLATWHASLNVVLFPPLFFFSALYYTDIASTLSCMVSYWYFLRALPSETFSIRRAGIQVLLGTASLFFRQTNIFWVAVFPAALTLVARLDQGHEVVKKSMYRRAEGFGDSIGSIAKTSYKMSVVYDPLVRDAFIEDYLSTVVSIAACALKASTQPKRILHVASALSPYLALTAIFTTFIIWNGGVVLGDKSNHIATINLPQMLYLWPFLAFFSWPLLLPTLTAITPLALITRLGLPLRTMPQPRPLLPPPPPPPPPTLPPPPPPPHPPIHPFTLSDNRHYHFYIFKRLLRPHWLRHLAAPVYISCAWACLSAPAQHPTAAAAAAAAAPRGEIAKPARGEDDLGHAGGGEAGARVSGTLATVAVTALTLCSAPLVEPRYCIIPFVVWRMQFPLREGGATRGGGRSAAESGLLRGYGCRLMLLETIWFLAINAVTGYIFLHWTFTWPQEPGVQQRFMW